MALAGPFRFAAAVTAGALLLAILFFFQMKDPMMLFFGIQLSLLAWVAAVIVHVLQHGIPIRIVDDERRRQ